MALFAISDLHLALGVNKPMDMFGGNWINYMLRIKESWEEIVTSSDCVLIPGDISWATYLEQSYEDFKFISALPGDKILLKGNHDYWWTTLKKLDAFMQKNSFTSVKFLHNNCYEVENTLICGTRGWKCPGDEDFGEEDNKIFQRELQRMELSLKCAARVTGGTSAKRVVVVMHYMPFNTRREPSGFVEIMERYNVRMCLYGHLHGEGIRNAVEGITGGIEYRLVSADYLDFRPMRLDTT